MVTVKFKGKTKDGNHIEERFMDADSFGVQGGDLILVKGITTPGGQMVGQNQYAFASGHWLSVKVEQTRTVGIPTPQGGFPGGISRQ